VKERVIERERERERLVKKSDGKKQREKDCMHKENGEINSEKVEEGRDGERN
jgi:hypothetical protein